MNANTITLLLIAFQTMDARKRELFNTTLMITPITLLAHALIYLCTQEMQLLRPLHQLPLLLVMIVALLTQVMVR